MAYKCRVMVDSIYIYDVDLNELHNCILMAAHGTEECRVDNCETY